MSAPFNGLSLKFSFTSMVRIGTSLRYANSVLWARRESQWCNKEVTWFHFRQQSFVLQGTLPLTPLVRRLIADQPLVLWNLWPFISTHVIVLFCNQLSCLKWSFSRYSRGMSCSSSLPLRRNRSRQVCKHIKKWETLSFTYYTKTKTKKSRHFGEPSERLGTVPLVKLWDRWYHPARCACQIGCAASRASPGTWPILSHSCTRSHRD